MGSRCEPTAAAIAKVAEARSLVFEGATQEGLRLLDEAAAAMMSGDMASIPAGMIDCELVCGAIGVGQYDLAEQWTAASERWSRSCTGAYHGVLAAHHKLRSGVVASLAPPPDPSPPPPAQLPLFEGVRPSPRQSRHPWSWLLRRVFT